jgi:hypothetical protein
MASEKDIVNKIIKKYGPVIDVHKNPDVMIDILRRFAAEDDGGLPGGTPPSPPPGPTSFQDRVTNEDLMEAILQLARKVKAMSKPVQKRSRR